MKKLNIVYLVVGIIGALIGMPVAIKELFKDSEPVTAVTATQDGNYNLQLNGDIKGDLNYNVTSDSQPLIVMNIEKVNEENPFKTSFIIQNNGDADAEDVNVSVPFFEYFGEPIFGHPTHIYQDSGITELNEKPNRRGNIGSLYARGGQAPIQIDDWIVFSSDKSATLELGRGTSTRVDQFTIIGGGQSPIINLPSQTPESLDSVLMCFKVAYKTQKKVNPRVMTFGYLIDKSYGLNNWTSRNDACSEKGLKVRRDNIEKEYKNSRG